MKNLYIDKINYTIKSYWCKDFLFKQNLKLILSLLHGNLIVKYQKKVSVLRLRHC